MTRRLTTAQAIIRFLEKQQVSRDGKEQPFFAGCFGIFGHGNVAGIGQALEQNPSFPYYLCRNEQAMVHTAAAFAKTSNRLRTLACTSSIGPGATNMVTGIATAMLDSSPIVCITGQVGSKLIGSDAFQESDVTGVTLSKEQHAVSSRRALEDGVADNVRFKLLDYRQELGKYDRIVSVGMFEHVGVAHYIEFFTKVKELLADDGVMLLHSIGRMEPPGATNTWLRKYIFPGGYTPAMSEVLTAIEKVGLWVTDIEVLRLHYAETLRLWRQRFVANREKIKQMAGYDDRFCRMWDFYLAGCEVAFRYMNQMVFQIQITRRQDAVPLTRDYLIDAENAISVPSSMAAE